MLFPITEKDIVYSDITIFFIYNFNILFYYKYLLELEKINEKFSEINLYGININYFNNFINLFKIENVPRILLFKKNKLIKNFDVSQIDSILKYVNDI